MFLRCQEFTQANLQPLYCDSIIFVLILSCFDSHIYTFSVYCEKSLWRDYSLTRREFFFFEEIFVWLIFLLGFFFREEIWIIQNQTNAQIEDQLFFAKPTAPKAASWLVCSSLTEEFSLAFSIAMLRSWQTYENVSTSTSKNLLQSSREIWPNSEGHF